MQVRRYAQKAAAAGTRPAPQRPSKAPATRSSAPPACIDARAGQQHGQEGAAEGGAHGGVRCS